METTAKNPRRRSSEREWGKDADWQGQGEKRELEKDTQRLSTLQVRETNPCAVDVVCVFVPSFFS